MDEKTPEMTALGPPSGPKTVKNDADDGYVIVITQGDAVPRPKTALDEAKDAFRRAYDTGTIGEEDTRPIEERVSDNNRFERRRARRYLRRNFNLK